MTTCTTGWVDDDYPDIYIVEYFTDAVFADNGGYSASDCTMYII